MADIRQTFLLQQVHKQHRRGRFYRALTSVLKLALRRFVVATSGPLRPLYVAIYRFHVAYAVYRLKSLPGVHSIYLTGATTARDLKPGISDIDLAVNGNFSAEQERRVAETLGLLSRLSPLFDTQLWQNARSLSVVKSLYESDYYFQYRFNRGRSRWKRLYGDDLFALLPPVPGEKLAGGYYSEIRLWWTIIMKSIFGSGPTAKDRLFQNSIPFKSVGEILNMAAGIENGIVYPSRTEALAHALSHAQGSEREFLMRLDASGRQNHLQFHGDIQNETLRFLLPLLERVHSKLPQTPAFEPLPIMALHVDASASEMLRTPAVDRHISDVVAQVKRQWSGYRAAFLVPSLSCLNPDDLVLLIDTDPAQLPTVQSIRELCRFHLERSSGLPQRVALFLLLPEAAYQLDFVSDFEMWHHLLCPAANPEVFALLNRPEFLLDGPPRTTVPEPTWTAFAQHQVNEELGIRRAAMAQAAIPESIGSLDVLRGAWRQIQLEIVQKSSEFGFVMLPLTVPAMQRALALSGLPDLSLFDRLRDAYLPALEGNSTDVRPLMSQLMEFFAAAQPPAPTVPA